MKEQFSLKMLATDLDTTVLHFEVIYSGLIYNKFSSFGSFLEEAYSLM